MVNANSRLGASYGKLGISTNHELILRRAEGIDSASSAIVAKDIPSLLSAAFEIGNNESKFSFLSHFEKDITFAVDPGDREAVLLAGSLLEKIIENNNELSGQVAIAVVTCAFDGLRAAPYNAELISIAKKALANFQGSTQTKLKHRTYIKQTSQVTEAIAAAASSPTHYGSMPNAQGVAAFKALGAYVESSSLASANSDQEILDYVRSLEEQLQTYWWATGGWSTTANKPFRQLNMPSAAIFAGMELAEVNSAEFGLFAAPALINLIIEKNRETPFEKLTLQDAVLEIPIKWRKEKFSTAASGDLTVVLPVSTALGMSAKNEDAEDWKPQFKRATGFESSTALSPDNLGFQIYLERIVAGMLE